MFYGEFGWAVEFPGWVPLHREVAGQGPSSVRYQTSVAPPSVAKPYSPLCAGANPSRLRRSAGEPAQLGPTTMVFFSFLFLCSGFMGFISVPVLFFPPGRSVLLVRFYEHFSSSNFLKI
jgi:hypothetical protein